MKKAIIIGASGLVGSHLVDLLLADTRYEKIVSLVRKKSTKSHSKLEEYCCDFSNLPTSEKYFEHMQELFICIGTTQQETPDKQQYFAIDYGIPTESASIALRMGIQTIVVISAMGADTNSRIFYNATKGKMEEYLQHLKIPRLIIVRPSLIAGVRPEKRLGEQIAKALFKALNLLIPKKYRAIEAKDIALAMLLLAHDTSNQTTWENDELLLISQRTS